MAFLSGRGTTATVTGGYVHIIIPNGAAPTGFDSFRISVTDFQAALQSQITTNTSNIATNASNITILQNGLTKVLSDSQNSNYTIVQNADSRIINFGFRVVSGSPTVSVGTGTGISTSSDIVSSAKISGLERSIDVSEYIDSNRTLYISISDGTVDVAIFSRENLYEV